MNESCKYIKAIDKQLRMIDNHPIQISINIKDLSNERLRYIHALDMFMHNKVISRVRNKNCVYAVIDGNNVEIRFRKGKISRYSCSCRNDICEHILATLIALEKEPDSFNNNVEVRLKQIISIYKDLINSIIYNTLEEDIQLLNMLRAIMIDGNHDQHIIGFLSFGILATIEKKYCANILQIINEGIANNINSIINIISKKDVITNRSWDTMLMELLNVR